MPPRNSFLAAALLCLGAAPAAAQRSAAAAPAPVGAQSTAASAAAPAAAAAPVEYQREVFRYQRGGRPDPFQPLLTAAELGFRVEDLRLTSIVYSPNPRTSLAIFAEGDSARRHRLRVGQRLGNMTVLRIYPQRVDVSVDDFGSSRVETIQLRRAGRRAEVQQQAGPPAAAAAQSPQIPVTIAPAPQEQPRRPQPLRRGPAAAAARAGQAGQAAPPPAPAPAPTRGINPRSPNYTSRPRP
ncbi:MAG TPA: hypothetical protein VF746_01250 [Longimicrobium sp.]|jgi:hypothetical protein